jgi:signal transduction histidine kinase
MVKENLKKIHENSNYILESMSDIVWAINPVNDSFEKTLFRMKEFAADILEPLNIQYEFKLSEGLHSISMQLKKRKDFFLFFKEALNNAAKYSHCTKVGISIVQQNDFVVLQAEDNGIGFDTGKDYRGNGLRNMKQRADQMNGEFTINSEPGKGTSIYLKIKSHD